MPRFDPEQLAARVLVKTDDVIVIDKPPGVAVHKGPGGADDLERHLHRLRFGRPADPGLAHRLDKDTTGCLVLGRSREALAGLGRLFRDGRVAKTYWAVVVGPPFMELGGLIDVPLARRSHDRRSWWMKADADGDSARTRWRLLGAADGLSWLELSPETGRTHQLRVHCAHVGRPIVGDHVYGGDAARAAARHMHLHARAVAFPWRGSTISAEAAPPEHMRTLLAACGWRAEEGAAALEVARAPHDL